MLVTSRWIYSAFQSLPALTYGENQHTLPTHGYQAERTQVLEQQRPKRYVSTCCLTRDLISQALCVRILASNYSLSGQLNQRKTRPKAGLVRWLGGFRCLLPNLTTWVWSLGPLTRWKERTSSCQLSSDLHACVPRQHILSLPRPLTQNKQINKHNTLKKQEKKKEKKQRKGKEKAESKK